MEARNGFAHPAAARGDVLMERLLGALPNSSAPLENKERATSVATGPAVFSTGPLPGSPCLPCFPERGRCELPWDSNHHQVFQFLI